MPKGCSAIFRGRFPRPVGLRCWPERTPSGLAIRPRRIRHSLVPPPGGNHATTCGDVLRDSHWRLRATWRATAHHGRVAGRDDQHAAALVDAGYRVVRHAVANVFTRLCSLSDPHPAEQRGLTWPGRAGVGHARFRHGADALIAWGYAVDRLGERLVLTVGSALAAAAALGAALASRWWGCLLCCSSAEWPQPAATQPADGWWSGWFEPQQRWPGDGYPTDGAAAGSRAGALVIPRLAETAGIGAALVFRRPSALVAAAVCALGVRDPTRPAARGNGCSTGQSSPRLPTLRGFTWCRCCWSFHRSVVWTFTLGG